MPTIFIFGCLTLNRLIDAIEENIVARYQIWITRSYLGQRSRAIGADP